MRISFPHTEVMQQLPADVFELKIYKENAEHRTVVIAFSTLALHCKSAGDIIHYPLVEMSVMLLLHLKDIMFFLIPGNTVDIVDYSLAIGIQRQNLLIMKLNVQDFCTLRLEQYVEKSDKYVFELLRAEHSLEAKVSKDVHKSA